MKILYTSDLHIGKRLYQSELIKEQLLFFDWLTDLVHKEKIDLILVCGDVFDVANPSSESRKIYYELLVKLARLKCRVIITAGNHDSSAVLEAPRELLKQLEIFVIGSLPENSGDMLIPIKGADDKTSLVVAAIPFLRDSDLRKRTEDESFQERTDAVRSGIISIYHDAAEKCRQLYPGIPAIAMGHLYIQGGALSDSEREIQIGNLAGIQAEKLPGYFLWYALGHLHKPQKAGSSENICYGGSPVQLSFSEAANKNRVVLLTLENNNLSHSSIPVPVMRRLIRLSGTVSELKRSLYALKPDPSLLKTFIELEAVEENPDPSRVAELETIINEFNPGNAEILKYRIRFLNQPAGTADLYENNVNIEELKPVDVFERKMSGEGVEEETGKKLKNAFGELLEEVLQIKQEK